MREIGMGLNRASDRVFALMFVVWLVTAVLSNQAIQHVPNEHVEQANEGSGPAYLYVLYWAVVVTSMPFALEIRDTPGGETAIYLGEGAVGPLPLVVGFALNALLWAALITVAYVLIRRLRDRRHVSKDV